jgi:AI-2 transport protein TqsA
MPTESPTWELTRRLISQVASTLANFLLESLVVAFYMIFLLQEAGRFGDRIRSSFSREHATQIEVVTASINRAITDYLSVKVKSSLIVAVPTALTVYAFGITGAATWGVLAFFGNFLPYIGGLVATLLPITLAFLEFESVLYPTLFAVVLLGISGVTSNLIEPAMTGKALDLSPLVVMIGLAFWSLLWGLVGMCLAIPLTVVLKIILEHTPATRPIARLLGESQRPG